MQKRTIKHHAGRPIPEDKKATGRRRHHGGLVFVQRLSLRLPLTPTSACLYPRCSHHSHLPLPIVPNQTRGRATRLDPSTVPLQTTPQAKQKKASNRDDDNHLFVLLVALPMIRTASIHTSSSVRRPKLSASHSPLPSSRTPGPQSNGPAQLAATRSNYSTTSQPVGPAIPFQKHLSACGPPKTGRPPRSCRTTDNPELLSHLPSDADSESDARERENADLSLPSPGSP